MPENKHDTGVQSHVEGRTLVMERVFNAPRDLVFEAYAKSEHLENWWGPKGWETENIQFEFKPNGVWHYCMRCTDKEQGDFFGQEACGKAIYHDIISPEKIVCTDVFCDKEGNVFEEMPEVVVTMNFNEDSGKTILVTRSQFETEADLHKVKEMGVVEGTASQFECLDAYLRSLQS
ncbi:SRPBCC domain-containing protein [Thalassobacillus sp. CUG 92003]|uniref:SRPBCC domain-containing protein n=1 Tax=Thalassobacillus sp. CUG 92003 TaxID=2736641 RepID=UPI0015E72675|nr:SRPBCC domain-containing protein [Thalassobacillus sp. CUG 92003]